MSALVLSSITFAGSSGSAVSLPSYVRGVTSAAVPAGSRATHASLVEQEDETEEIAFGTSMPLSGPSADLGSDVRAGITAAFSRYNADPKHGSRHLVLVALDDGYEPTRTVPNMRRLCDDPQVIGIVGNVGTPTAFAALPIARRTNTPFIGAVTGAGLLRRDPPEPCVVNFRASYAEETAAMVDALVTIGHVAPEDIAFFAQRDAYGDAGCIGGLDALARHGLKDARSIVIATFERNSLAVEGALADILLAQRRPRAIIQIGTHAACAKFIRLARAHGVKSLFLDVSFVGSESLARELGDQANGVLITQVVPPFTAGVPIVDEYLADLAHGGREARRTFASFEGYIVGRMVTRALDDVTGPPTRESVRQSLLNLHEFDLGLGLPLRLDAEHPQASHGVWPTRLHDGAVEAFDWSGLPQLLGGG